MLRLWLDHIDVLVLFSELVLNLFDLVLEDLQSTLLVLKLLSVDVYLIL